MGRRCMLLLGIWLTACSPAANPTKSPVQASQERPSQPPEPGSGPKMAAQPSGPAPRLELRMDAEAGGLAPVLINRDQVTVSVRSSLAIERLDGSDWAPVANLQPELRLDCEAPVTPCLQLVPGAELHAPTAAGPRGTGQCGCKDCQSLPTGRYRPVLLGCKGEYRLTGTEFSLP